MALCSACPSGCDVSVTATVTVTDPAAKTVTSDSLTTSTSGSVAAGKSSITFYNYGAGVVTINGQPLAAGASITFPYLGAGVVYGVIEYDATGSDLRIDTAIIV